MQKARKHITLILLLLVTGYSGSFSQIIISELLSSNTSGLIDPKSGQFVDWVEIQNLFETPVDISGFFLSDDPDRPLRWSFPANTIIPAKGYMLLFPDKTDTDLHPDFGLSRDGESLSLFDPNGQLLDFVEFTEQKPDVSYGRSKFNLLEWVYFAEPTPGQANSTPEADRLKKSTNPKISPPAGFYSAPQEIIINPGSDESLSVHFTLDGSTPTRNSPEWKPGLQIRRTTCLKVRSFSDNKLPGDILTNTYFFESKTNLPVFSIAMNPEYLWDEKIGIYTDGENFNGERESRNCCQKDWQRPMHIEFFDSDGHLVFSEPAGVEVKGRMNCEFPKKPLGVYFKSKYGESSVVYQFFREKTVTEFSDFVLRPGGADGMGDCYNGTMIRDGLLSTLLINQMDIDYEGYRPAILYINGEYWGIHNVRERNKADYLAQNHGIDPDNLDILENPDNGGIIAGDDEHYKNMLQFSRSMMMMEEEGYQTMSEMMDIREFLNYQIAEIFVNNEDWAQNNVICWRPRTEDGKWRWIFYDVEGGFGLYSSEDYLNDLFDFKQDFFLRHAALFEGVMRNSQIRNEFIQSFAAHLNSTFSPDRVIHLIDSLSNDIAVEMSRDVARWRGHQTNGGSGCSPINSLQQWHDHLEIMREFARKRPDIIREQLQTHYSLDGMARVDLIAEGGAIDLNGVAHARSGLYFKSVPINLRAIPDAGYEFVSWNGIDTNDQITFNPDSDTILTAMFIPTGEPLIPPIVNKTTILTPDKGSFAVSGDIVVERGASLRIEAGVEVRMPPEASIYVYGELIIAGTATNPVRIVSDSTSGERWGALVLDRAHAGSSITNLIIENASLGARDAVRYKANLSICGSYVPVNGLTIKNGDLNGIYVEQAEANLRQCTISTQGTGDYINIARAPSALIEKCVFNGNSSPDTDAIDLDAVESAIIRENHFRNFTGFNSDGLDAGYCGTVMVERNIFSGIADKGISIGMGSKIIASENLVMNCTSGIGIKDEGSVYIGKNNTFFNNQTAIDAFEKDPGRGGGQAECGNSIFAGFNQTAALTDDYSSVSFSYCHSENSSLIGIGNKSGDPGLQSPENGIFRLHPTSPCRDAGNPEGNPDPDGTRRDIGAYYFHKNQYDGLFLNEVIRMPGEWIIEIYNTGWQPVPVGSIWLALDKASNGLISLDPVSGDESLIRTGDFASFRIPDSILNPLPEQNILLCQAIDGEVFILNTLKVSAFMDVYSRGCYPDGTYNWRHFTTITPGYPNKASSSGKGALFINELMASNSHTIADQNGEYDDWIELYNGGDEQLPLDGLYLTDHLENPTKHQLPLNSKSAQYLKPGEFALLWADGNVHQGKDHLNFRLDADDEEIGLFRIIYPDTIRIDSIKFRDQSMDISYGRYPDGSSELKYFYNPTPGTSNLYLKSEKIQNPLKIKVFPNPCSHYVSVSFEGSEETEATVQIMDLKGRILFRQMVDIHQAQPTFISVDHFPSGIYFLRANTKKATSTSGIIKL